LITAAMRLHIVADKVDRIVLNWNAAPGFRPYRSSWPAAAAANKCTDLPQPGLRPMPEDLRTVRSGGLRERSSDSLAAAALCSAWSIRCACWSCSAGNRHRTDSHHLGSPAASDSARDSQPSNDRRDRTGRRRQIVPAGAGESAPIGAEHHAGCGEVSDVCLR